MRKDPTSRYHGLQVRLNTDGEHTFRIFHAAAALLLLCMVVFAAGCGGGGGGGGGEENTSPPPSGLTYPSPQVFTVGVAITALNPTVTGSVTSYDISPALPAGLNLNPTTGQITGTPTTVVAEASYTINARNSSGSSAFVLSITVRRPAPSALSYASPQVFTIGTPIAPLNPTVNGAVDSYSVNPALPAGLTLNGTSGQISGTPTTVTATANYTVSAQNDYGSATFVLTITVRPLAPSALSYASPQTYPAGSAITPLNPTVTGQVDSYSVMPALPAGLTLDTATGRISGTPTAASGPARYTVTAQNATGGTTFDLSITIIAVDVLTPRIARMVSHGTTISAVIAVRPVNFTFSSSLHVAATMDVPNVFDSNVSVAPSGSGTLNLTLHTAVAAAEGHFAGNLTLTFCQDNQCAAFEPVTSVVVPFTIDVLTSSTPWLGNHLSQLNALPGVPDWTMFQGNASHSGYVPITLDPNQFVTRWHIGISNPGTQYYAGRETVATANGRFFMTGNDFFAHDYSLYARNEYDGNLVWQKNLDNGVWPSTNPPSVAGSVVYIVAGQQTTTKLFGLDATDGTTLSQGPMVSQFENYLAPTIGPQGVYTNGGSQGGVYGFGFSAQPLFFHQLAQTSMWTPAVDATGVYAYAGDALTVTDPMTGAVTHSIADPTFQNLHYQIGGSPVLGAAGSVFAATYTNANIDRATHQNDNTLSRFDVSTDSVAWHIAGAFPSTPAYDAGVLYVANEKPLRLEARAEADGTVLWSWTPPAAGGTAFMSEVLLTTNLIFISTDTSVYAIDRVTHEPVWSYPQPGRFALSRNGVLYVSGNSWLSTFNLQ
jgi:hypothetical protein